MDTVSDQAAEFRAELERLVTSAMFRGSPAVCRLLAYLGERWLAGEGGGLKEFTIGVEGFNKPADYDPQQDPTVRVVASKLRHKLGDYYQTEGRDHPVRIELPKGHYNLRLQPRQPAADGAGAPELSAETRRWRRRFWATALALAVVVPLATYWRVALSQREAAATLLWTPDMELFWQPYLEGNRPILIALGTPLFTKFSQGFFRDPRLNNWEQAEGSARLRAVQKALDSSYASPWYNFTGIGEASGTFLLSKLLADRRPDLLLKRSAAFSWEDLSTHSAIFLGSPKFNPQLTVFPFEQDFVIEGGSLRNLRPRPGEPQKFPEIWTPDHSALLEDHALLSHLPGLHGQGQIMVLAASSTEGTWGVTEYVTNPAHVRELVARLRSPSGSLPEAYQVVIRVKIKDGVPIDVTYVTHRVLRPSPGAPAR